MLVSLKGYNLINLLFSISNPKSSKLHSKFHDDVVVCESCRNQRLEEFRSYHHLFPSATRQTTVKNWKNSIFQEKIEYFAILCWAFVQFPLTVNQKHAHLVMVLYRLMCLAWWMCQFCYTQRVSCQYHFPIFELVFEELKQKKNVGKKIDQ